MKSKKYFVERNKSEIARCKGTIGKRSSVMPMPRSNHGCYDMAHPPSSKKMTTGVSLCVKGTSFDLTSTTRVCTVLTRTVLKLLQQLCSMYPEFYKVL